VRGHRKVASAFLGVSPRHRKPTSTWTGSTSSTGRRRTPYRWLDLAKLCRLYFPNDDVRKIKYFTAIVSARPSDPDQPLRQQLYLRALQTLPKARSREARQERRNPESSPAPELGALWSGDVYEEVQTCSAGSLPVPTDTHRLQRHVSQTAEMVNELDRSKGGGPVKATVEAIFEDGVFKPLQRPAISEGDHVQLTVETVARPEHEDPIELAARPPRLPVTSTR